MKHLFSNFLVTFLLTSAIVLSWSEYFFFWYSFKIKTLFWMNIFWIWNFFQARKYHGTKNSADTEQNLDRNSPSLLKNLGAQTCSLAQTSAWSELQVWRSSLGRNSLSSLDNFGCSNSNSLACTSALGLSTNKRLFSQSCYDLFICTFLLDIVCYFYHILD